MTNYNKQKIEDFKKQNLIIYWWNFGSKTLDFKGTVYEYLKNQNINYTISAKKDNDFDFEKLVFKVKMSVGSMNYNFTGYDLDDLIRMSINIRLSYLGDKSKYILGTRTRTINF